MNNFQSPIINVLQKSRTSLSVSEIARKAKLDRAAVTSALRSMYKRGLVGRVVNKDRRTNEQWFIAELVEQQ